MPMHPVFRVDGKDASSVEGRVALDWHRIIWNGGLMLMAIATVPFHTSWDSVLMFFILTYFTLLFGHSIGMHRMMVHRTFKTSRWIYRILVYIGALVGMSNISKRREQYR